MPGKKVKPQCKVSEAVTPNAR